MVIGWLFQTAKGLIPAAKVCLFLKKVEKNKPSEKLAIVGRMPYFCKGIRILPMRARCMEYNQLIASEFTFVNREDENSVFTPVSALTYSGSQRARSMLRAARFIVCYT
jgi:hypothetical protein